MTPVFILTSDANAGWGALQEKSKSQDRWPSEEEYLHINANERLAVLFLKCLCKTVNNLVREL